MNRFMRRVQQPPEHPAKVIAKRDGIKIKRPADYVVIIGDRIIDGKRVHMIRAVLPPDLPPGTELLYKTPDKGTVTVTVVHDYGDDVKIALSDKTEVMVPRSLLALQAFPTRPTLVHKSKLYKYIGEKAAARFWDAKIRLRVPAAPPPKSKR